MKRITKSKVIVVVVILAVLAGVFWWGGNAPGLRGWNPSTQVVLVSDSESLANQPMTDPETDAATPSPSIGEVSTSEISDVQAEPNISATPEILPEQAPAVTTPEPVLGWDADSPLTADEKLALAASMVDGESSESVAEGNEEYSASMGMDIGKETGKDRYLTDPVPEGKPIPVEPQDAVIVDKAMTCTMSVRCDTILDNISWLDPEKVELVPTDGAIFTATAVTFYEGESVFNILLREMKKARIHMEFENTPMYNSAYIEGINNLYEFDCGELSGWMYKVNDWFPNYGCSRYQLMDGDIVEWVFTCNLGIDVGGYYAIGGE